MKQLSNHEHEAQKLKKRVLQLERKLAEAKATLHELNPSEADGAAEPSDRLSRALFDAPYPLMIRRDDGKVMMVNAAWTKITGYTLDDIPTIADWARQAYGMNAEQQEALIPKDGFSQVGIKKWGEFEVRTKDDQKRIWDFSTAPMGPDEDGHELVMAMAVDVTDRNQAEQAIRDSEERFAKTFIKAPFGMNITRWSDGMILDANDAWLNMLGWRREEVLGKTTAEFPFYANPKDRVLVRQRIMNNESLSDIELELVRKDGVIRTVTVATTLMEILGERCILGVINDITDRKQAEDALRESEHRYRELFETMQEGLVAGEVITDDNFNPIDYRYLEVNPATERQFGKSREEFIGNTYTEVLPDGDREWIEILGRVALTGDPANVERYSHGLKRWFESHAYSPRAGQFVNIMTDITERKKTEEALQASEAKLRAVFRALVEGIVFLNPQGQVEDINPAMQRTYGHTLEELTDPARDPRNTIVRPDGTLFPVEQQPAMVALRTGEAVQNVEMGVTSADGKISWRLVNAQPVYNDAGTLLGAVASLFDITERKQAEQALRESEQRFHSLADSMPQLVWTALPDGAVDYYNKRYLEYQEIKEVKGAVWEWAPVLHPDDADATVNAWQHSVRTGEIYQIEHRVRMADGSYRWHLSRGIPVLDEQGRIARWFGTATDINEQKTAAETLKTYTERLERSNRELEQFAFMASHDLQEPLRKIQVFGDLLADRAQTLNERELEYVERMRNAAGRMREMVNGLLQLSRVNTQGNSFTTVDLSRVTAGALSDHVELIEKTNGVVEVASLPMVMGDPLQLRQLMQNLIGNAVKYHRPDVYPRVRVYAEKSADAVKIFVQDNGIGFEQENAERIFQPFQRLVGRSQYEGSGMGLAICQKIVERHGGEIKAESKPGEGTTFIVMLPQYPSPNLEEDNHEYKATDPDR